jgi:Putative porin
MEKKMSRFKGLVLAVLILLPLPAWAAEDLTDLLVEKGTITKEEADSLQKRSIASYVDSITFYGDFRLREEGFWYSGVDNGFGNKNRQRFRLRLGTDITEGWLKLHVRLASGQGEQVSTNQSMRCLSCQKSIWIDRAYVEVLYFPDTSLMGGRMANPFYVSPTGELVFDDDYNPEGFAETYNLKLGDTGKAFLNIGQFILDSDNSPDKAGSGAQWFLGYQVGTKMKVDPVDVNAAILYYSLANGEKPDNFSQTATQDGNTRKPCTAMSAPQPTNCLANPFNVIDASVAVMFNAGLPITVSGDYVENLADTVQSVSPSIKDQTTAFAIGFKVGKASAPNSYEAGYMYRSVETDATLADLADSDFGPNGGTNRKGHVVWAAYNLTKAAQVKVKYFNTKVKDDNLPPAPIDPPNDTNPTFNRIQLDFSVKF